MPNPWQVPWTSDDLAMLRRLWDENHPTQAIAIALSARPGAAHRSKNAVIGAAHRLKLAKRPSPICPSKQPAPPPAPAAAKPPPQPQPADEEKEAAIQAYREGKPLAEIAAAIGVKPSTLWSWADKAGKRRPRDPRILTAFGHPPSLAAPEPPPPPPPPPPQPRRRCQYPIETDGFPRYRYCDAPVFEGAPRRTPYCKEHYHLCRLPRSALVKEAANA